MVAAKPEHFLPIYWQWFPPEPFTLLEIGVHTGGSMRLWRERFPASRIIGLDHDISQSGPIEGVELREGDQGNPETLQGLIAEFGGFDVVIDDGSHVWSDQLASLYALWPHTRCIYAIEDIETSYPGLIPYDVGQWAGGPNTMDVLKSRIDDLGSGSIHFYRGLVILGRDPQLADRV